MLIIIRCTFGCLDKELVQGKIVVCSTTDGIEEVYRLGVVGSILLGDAEYNFSFVAPLLVSILSPQDVSLVEAYVKSTKYKKKFYYFLYFFLFIKY